VQGKNGAETSINEEGKGYLLPEMSMAHFLQVEHNKLR